MTSNYLHTSMVAVLLLLMGAWLNTKTKADTITPELQEILQNVPNEVHTVYVLLKDQVDVELMFAEMKKNNLPVEERAKQLIQALQKKAALTQGVVKNKLTQLKGIQQFHAYWITNVFEVTADVATIETMSKWQEVDLIEPVVPPTLFNSEVAAAPAMPVPNGTELGLRAINAPRMWRLGYTGYGRKVLVIDSGQNVEHPALKPNFWGHNTARNQAWTGTAKPDDCGDHHGTHVTGITVGLDRTTNDTIGVAFNARWMGSPFPFTGENSCDLKQYGIGQNSSLAHFEWALNPDRNPNTTDDIPDVINNSWGSQQSTCSQTFRNSMIAIEIAGIASVWAAGNSGPDARSMSMQANLNITIVNSFAVGSVDVGRNNIVSDFSSRGPSSCGGNGALGTKPELVAPGQSSGFVRSAGRDANYIQQGGTSQAAPHVAGALLLLKEAFPFLSGEDLKLALYFSARDLGEPGEDNNYGMGLIDVFAAYNYLINQGHTPVPPVSAANDVILLDVKTEKSVLCRGTVDLSINIENVTRNNLNNLQVRYFTTNNPANVKTHQWTGDLCVNCTTSAKLPALENMIPGDYELVVEIFNPNGQTDERSLNNRMIHTFKVIDLPAVDAKAALLNDQTVCRNTRILLTSNTTLAENQKITWHTQLERGAKLGEGSTFLTAPITNSNSTFYADLITHYKTGRENLVQGQNNGLNVENGGLVFNAIQPFTLVSVKVYAEETGGRFVRLLDAEGKTLQQRIVRFEIGEQRITLNFDVPAGEGYQLVLASGRPIYHSNEGTQFPYEVPGVIRITRSTAAPFFLRYLFFYDWEIEVPHGCGRTAVPVNINLTANAPVVLIESSTNFVTLQEGGNITFTDRSSNVRTRLWDFGDGTSSNAANPTHTYQSAGTYNVFLTIENTNGCINTASVQIKVTDESTSSTNNPSEKFPVRIFPNPTQQQLNIITPNSRQVELRMVDLMGRTVMTKTFGGDQTMLNIHQLPAGVYYLWLNIDGKQWIEKVVKVNY